MANIIFEVGVEELPAQAVPVAIEFSQHFLLESLKNLRLSFENIQVMATPRRIVIFIDGLDDKQKDLQEEILGPNVKIAFESEGNLSKAGLGFLKSKNISQDQIYTKNTKKGDIIAAKTTLAGKTIEEILPELFVDLLKKIPFKKRMRWEKNNHTFARPIRWLLALVNEKILEVGYADVKSSNKSFGHRFLSPEAFEVKNKDQYLREQKERFVMLSMSDRINAITEQATLRAKEINAEFDFDQKLLEEVANLVEYPFVILGEFEERYLKIPKEILICEMKTHQRCFPLFDHQKNLKPNFICVAAVEPYDEKVFAQGNARVLRARFEDGAFYFEQDKKIPLAKHQEKLANLVFEKDLGSVQAKSERILKISLALLEELELGAEVGRVVSHAAPLAKADLVTGVVGEFPELQGFMGSVYAALNGADKQVSDAIETHYWPRFADDFLPKNKAAALLSIADKIDTLVGIIGIGKKPKGNKDPFALRRSAIGIVRILVAFGFHVSLQKLVDFALRAYDGQLKSDNENIRAEALEFIVQRARGLLIDELEKKDKHNAVSFVDSVLAINSDDLLDASARANTLFLMRNQSEKEFESLTQTFKRASNIVKKAQSEGINFHDQMDENLLASAYEKDLLSVVTPAKQLMHKNAQTLESLEEVCAYYEKVFEHVKMIKPKLDQFFDNLMVMDKDQKIRNARLALLSDIKNLADRVADFTHL